MPRKTKKTKRMLRKYGGTRSNSISGEYISARSNPIDSFSDERDSFRSAEDDIINTCAICMDPLNHYIDGNYKPTQSLFTTECNHTFHFDCIKEALSRNNRCPICRTVVNNYRSVIGQLPIMGPQNQPIPQNIPHGHVMPYRAVTQAYMERVRRQRAIRRADDRRAAE